MTRRYEVYQLRASDEDREFYIGKTYSGSRRKLNHIRPCASRSGRWRWNKIRSIHARGASVIYEVMYTFDTDEEAKAKEVELITERGRLIDGSGYLTNATLGGEGTVGFVHSEVSKRKMAEAVHRRILEGYKQPSFGGSSVPVTAFTEAGDFVKVFPNSIEAGRHLGVSKDGVRDVIRGRAISATDKLGVKYQFLRGVWLDPIPPALVKPWGNWKRPILQFSLSGELIGRYPNGKYAAIKNGISNEYLHSRCNSKLKAKSRSKYIWRFEKVSPEDSRYIEW